jgi:phosphinothricin acetyltransferase
MITIRSSRASDIGAITTIYGHHVLHGTGTFEVTPPSEQDIAGRRDDVLQKGLPYLVAEDAQEVLGFAYCNWFKPRPAYRYSAEDSIYLAPVALGRGLGRLLLVELIAQAERAGVRKLIAVIGDSSNHGSIGVHQSCGFEHVGTLSSCGWKFDRWLDVVMMDRAIGPGSACSPSQSPA